MTLVMAAIPLNLVLRWPPKAFGLRAWQSKHDVAFVNFDNPLPLSWRGCVLNGSPIIRMLPILLISGVQSCSVPEASLSRYFSRARLGA